MPLIEYNKRSVVLVGDAVLASDLHLGHPFVAKLRGFDDVRAHDDAVLRGIFRAADKDRPPLVLAGDISFLRRGPTANIFGAIGAIYGQVILVRGNHDNDDSMKIAKSLGWIVRDYVELDMRFEADAEGVRAVCSHYPLLTWRSAAHGWWMLHGHSHGNLHDTGTRRVDIGLDNKALDDLRPEPLAPVRLSAMVGFMERRRYRAVDHHVAKEDT